MSIKKRNETKPDKKFRLSAVILAMLLVFVACEDKSANTANSVIKPITSYEMFKNLVESSGDRLLVFDMYADWCGPCKTLSPILEKIAVENKDKADIYKVDVMKLPKIADMFGVKEIPFVQFVKNKKNLVSLVGLRKKEDYEKTIREFATVPQSPTPDTRQPADVKGPSKPGPGN